jgi:prepilin-type N-terminal cleavage/methylation domain-containing protein/prepilin-type processing-associated H-X9-DG protein
MRADGFTLLELLVTLAIIGVLISLLGPALARMLSTARSLQCQASLRTVALDFALFATDGMHTSRGDDARLDNRFRLSTFQESEYEIDEFWSHGDADTVVLDEKSESDPLRCSEVRAAVSVTQNQACTSSGAINPPQNVSYGFNSRLHRAEVEGPGGFQLPRPVFLTSAILQEPDVPLAWDVDGKKAFSTHVLPQFSAPSLDSQSVYAADRFWFPSFRHGGLMNVAFVGGQVLSTRTPLEEPGWKWAYQPVR